MREASVVIRVLLSLSISFFVLVTGAATAQEVPQILDLTYRPAPFHADSGIEVLPSLYDGDDKDVTFLCRWFVSDEEIEDVQGVLLPGDRFQRGDSVAVEVIPEKNGYQGRPVKSGAIEAGNAPPRIVSQPPQSLSLGLYSYRIEAVDADGDLLTYSLLDGPDGMQLGEESGLLTWDMTGWQGGEVRVTVAVEDGFGGQAQQEFSMNPTFTQDEGSTNE